MKGNGSNDRASYLAARTQTLMPVKHQNESFARGITTIDTHDNQDTKSFTIITSSGATKRTDTFRGKSKSSETKSKYLTGGSDEPIPLVETSRFDKIHNFIFYFPHNNCETVLKYFETKRRFLKGKRSTIKRKRTEINGLIDYIDQKKFYQQEVKSPARKRGLSPTSKRNNIFSLKDADQGAESKKFGTSKTLK